MVIAVDGPAGVGKSTISNRVAEKLGFYYLNSGNVYRAITLAVLEAGIDPANNQHVIDVAKRSKITFENGRIHLNTRDVEEELHTDRIDAWVAPHSAIIPIRHLVNDVLRQVTRNTDSIVEGRDISTVVFPNAEVKIFLDAEIRVRAERRFRQGVSGQTMEELTASIEVRDQIDRNKKEGSLIIAPDAVYIDTSVLTIDQVCERVVGKIRETQYNNQSGSLNIGNGGTRGQ